jgi:hypothetical protein
MLYTDMSVELLGFRPHYVKIASLMLLRRRAMLQSADTTITMKTLSISREGALSGLIGLRPTPEKQAESEPIQVNRIRFT